MAWKCDWAGTEISIFKLATAIISYVHLFLVMRENKPGISKHAIFQVFFLFCKFFVYFEPNKTIYELMTSSSEWKRTVFILYTSSMTFLLRVWLFTVFVKCRWNSVPIHNFLFTKEASNLDFLMSDSQGKPLKWS